MNPKDLLGALKKKLESAEQTKNSFESCDALYKAHLDEGLPIYLGVNAKENSYLLSFNHDVPIELDQSTLFYLYDALGKLIEDSQKDYFNIEGEDLTKKFAKTVDGMPIGVTMIPQNKATGKIPSSQPKTHKEALDALSDILGEVGEGTEEIEEVETEEYTGKQEVAPIDAKNIVEEAIHETLQDPEELKKMQEEAREKMFSDLKEFQKVLMGDLKEEAAIEYNEEYFKDIFDKHGPEMLKEELAKLPPEERKPIIANIIREHKQNNG